MVAGISEINSSPTKFQFNRFIDIYQEYHTCSCTVWNQLWHNSINDTTKSFFDNRWDNQWWNYELNFDSKTFYIFPPTGSPIIYPIVSEGVYRVFIEVARENNCFIIEEVEDNAKI